MNEMETDETIKSKSLKIIIILFFTGFTIFAMVASLTLGSVDISFSTIVHTLLGNVQTTDEMVIWNIRFPRNIVGALVGANLAVSGFRTNIVRVLYRTSGRSFFFLFLQAVPDWQALSCSYLCRKRLSF